MMRQENAFTIAEMMIVIITSVMLIGGVLMVYIMSMRSWKEGSINTGLERTAAIIMEKIVRGPSGRFGLREADVGMVQISETGNSVTFAVDKQDPPTQWYSDDVTSRYYHAGTQAIYDPNVLISGDEIVLNRFGEVEDIDFSLSGYVVTARIVMTADAPRTTSRRLVARIQTDIFFRKRR